MKLYEGPLRYLPLLLILIVLAELYLLHRQKRPFDWRESVNSLVISVGQRIAGYFSVGLYGGIFFYCWQHRLFDIPVATWWGLTLLFFGQEFLYYWEHRLSHESRWFWASHVVHHSPNFLNLSAAYRLSWTAPFTGQQLIFLPLVLIGFHPLAVFGMLAINLLYQFWLHTELVPRLGWFDRIFNSPSNHRVHHAANLDYLDANYGGILIIFDRMFGTYIPERLDEPCRYGLVHPIYSHNPFKVVFFEWMNIGRDLRAAKSLRECLGILFKAPGWKAHGKGQTTKDLRLAAALISAEKTKLV